MSNEPDPKLTGRRGPFSPLRRPALWAFLLVCSGAVLIAAATAHPVAWVLVACASAWVVGCLAGLTIALQRRRDRQSEV